MPVDFARFLSPEARARLDRTRNEIARLHSLPDRWLARDLAATARRIRMSTPEMAAPTWEGDGYSRHLLWDVVPDLARRLGEPLQPNESGDARLRMAEGQDLRDWVGVVLQNTSWHTLIGRLPADRADDLHVLLHEAANGSPVAIALDRLVAPTDESRDYVASHLREISRHRGHETVAVWSPELQTKPPEPSYGPRP